MKIKLYMMLSLFVALCINTMAQTPTISWQFAVGGSGNDSLTDLRTTADGGFIACGKSNSNTSGNKSNNALGGYDYWVVKLNSAGAVTWNRTIGGMADDVNPYVTQTPDGGYLVAGKSVSTISGNKTEDAINLSYDYWVVKLDKNGLVQWDNTVGSIQLEAPRGLAVSADNRSYMVAGYAFSNNGYDKTELNRGSSVWSDYWLIKLNKKGVVTWNKTFGGGNEDVLTSFIRTSDAGYMMGGHSYSPAEYEKTDSFLGNNDYWIIKINSAGTQQWDKIYGGKFSDYQTCMAQTADGGYILGGYSNSPVSFSKTDGFRGGTDYWIVKIDAAGNKQWDKTFGGAGKDYLYSVKQTIDGGYILGGTSNSNAGNEKTENSIGGNDIWIVKLDANGNKIWDKTYGGSDDDILSSLTEISANEYIIGATSKSPVSGDKSMATVGGTGFNDFWVVRISAGGAKAKALTAQSAQLIVKADENPLTQKLGIRVSPNPTQDVAVINYTSVANGKLTLTVYDNNGKTVLQKPLANNAGTYSVNISGYAAGLYHFVITSGKSNATATVLKQ
ncbi:T9SS type A sorting domain-containing protein [Panacibacter sp. DH6]|uniref:T9SS type A sorting domain-containing protein n=1 Tax=Panacibacter microcysteis TaxID=2793269 RepID=A0A931E9W4_9BACT|nr:T9SS type A sorting domain-containing protein [Panacibacter microcysteis]MBG9377854.1 T9SS type A sorting domain-containing protein [Panacibacter microcysteis]